jgi:hypothetical protein
MASHPNRSRSTITLDAGKGVVARWNPKRETWQEALDRAIKRRWGSTASVWGWRHDARAMDGSYAIFQGTVVTKPRGWRQGDGYPVQAELWVTVPNVAGPLG